MTTSLHDDLLSTVTAIAEFIYGEATPRTERRVRHLIDGGIIPVKRIGGRIESRKSWINQVYAEPDRPAASGGSR